MRALEGSTLASPWNTHTPVSIQHVHAFYAASLVVLRFLDASSTGRRVFGPKADARWKGFRGDLELQDRIDLVVRDAAVRWGAAFSPARVFQLTGLAADEPFGPDWPGLDADAARKLWREAEKVEPSMAAVADAWHLKMARVEGGELKPATKVLVAGASAAAAVLAAFHGREDLSWADQVVVAGSSPVERQRAGKCQPLPCARQASPRSTSCCLLTTHRPRHGTSPARLLTRFAEGHGMALSKQRIQHDGETAYARERDAVDFVIAGLPDVDPHTAWNLVEQSLFVVEIRSHPGKFTGDSRDWTVEHEGRLKYLENPLYLTNRKSKVIAGLLTGELAYGHRARVSARCERQGARAVAATRPPLHNTLFACSVQAFNNTAQSIQ